MTTLRTTAMTARTTGKEDDDSKDDDSKDDLVDEEDRWVQGGVLRMTKQSSFESNLSKIQFYESNLNYK